MGHPTPHNLKYSVNNLFSDKQINCWLFWSTARSRPPSKELLLCSSFKVDTAISRPRLCLDCYYPVFYNVILDILSGHIAGNQLKSLKCRGIELTPFWLLLLPPLTNKSMFSTEHNLNCFLLPARRSCALFYVSFSSQNISMEFS